MVDSKNIFSKKHSHQAFWEVEVVSEKLVLFRLKRQLFLELGVARNWVEIERNAEKIPITVETEHISERGLVFI